MRQNSRGGGAITTGIIGLAGRFLDQLHTHIFKRVGKLDILGNGHTIINDGWCPPFLVQCHRVTFRTQRYLDSIGQNIYSLFQRLSRLLIKNYLFRHFFLLTVFRYLLAFLGQNIAFAQNHILFIVYLDLGAAVFGIDYDVANLDIHGNAFAIIG